MKKGIKFIYKDGDTEKFDVGSVNDLSETKTEYKLIIRNMYTVNKSLVKEVKIYDRCDICNDEVISGVRHSCVR